MNACIPLFPIATLVIVCAGLLHRLKNKNNEILRLENELLSQIGQKNFCERRLEKAKKFEDTLINSIPEIFCVIDEHGKIVKSNKRYEEVTKSTAGDIVNYNIFNILSEKSQDTTKQKIAEIFQTKYSFNVEVLVGESSDQKIPYFFTGAPFVVEGSKYSVGVGFDISFYKQAQEERSQSEERLRLAAEATELGTWDWNLVTGVYRWSDRGYAIFGLEPGTPVDFDSSLACVHPDDQEGARAAVLAALDPVNTLEFDTEFRVIWPDNSVHWVSACGKAYFEEIKGKIRATRMNGITLDITQRKFITEALRESEQKYRSLFAVEPDALILFDRQTLRIMEANHSALELYGYDRIEFMSLDILSVLACKNEIEDLFQTFWRDTMCRVESLHKNKNGKILPVEVSGCVFELNEREVIYFSIRDIAERKAMERELDESRKDLEAKVKLRTHELTEVNIKLQTEIVEHKRTEEELEKYHKNLLDLAAELSMAEDKERRKIASELHDDIGQILAMSHIRIESLLLSSSPYIKTASVEEIRDLVAQSIQKVRSLTSQLSPPLLHQVGFTAAIRWLGEKFQNENGLCIEILGAVVRKELGEEIAVTLFQIIRELLINITKHANAKNTSISIAKNKDEIVITIVDDGVGFEISENDKNDGFGLFNIQQKIKHLGGEILFSSNVGKGRLLAVSSG